MRQCAERTQRRATASLERVKGARQIRVQRSHVRLMDVDPDDRSTVPFGAVPAKHEVTRAVRSEH